MALKRILVVATLATCGANAIAAGDTLVGPSWADQAALNSGSAAPGFEDKVAPIERRSHPRQPVNAATILTDPSLDQNPAPAPVPEPATNALLLLGLGLAGVAGVARRPSATSTASTTPIAPIASIDLRA